MINNLLYKIKQRLNNDKYNVSYSNLNVDDNNRRYVIVENNYVDEHVQSLFIPDYFLSIIIYIGDELNTEIEDILDNFYDINKHKSRYMYLVDLFSYFYTLLDYERGQSIGSYLSCLTKVITGQDIHEDDIFKSFNNEAYINDFIIRLERKYFSNTVPSEIFYSTDIINPSSQRYENRMENLVSNNVLKRWDIPENHVDNIEYKFNLFILGLLFDKGINSVFDSIVSSSCNTIYIKSDNEIEFLESKHPLKNSITFKSSYSLYDHPQMGLFTRNDSGCTVFQTIETDLSSSIPLEKLIYDFHLIGS